MKQLGCYQSFPMYPLSKCFLSTSGLGLITEKAPLTFITLVVPTSFNLPAQKLTWISNHNLIDLHISHPHLTKKRYCCKHHMCFLILLWCCFWCGKDLTNQCSSESWQLQHYFGIWDRSSQTKMKARGLAGCYRILISKRGGTGEIVHSAHASALFEMLFSICPCLEYRAHPEVFVGNAESRNEVLAACLNGLINPEIQQKFQDCLPFRRGNNSWKELICKQTTLLQVWDLGFEMHMG